MCAFKPDVLRGECPRDLVRDAVAGAGDTFLATMGMAAAAGQSLQDAAKAGFHGGGDGSRKEGTAVCTADELMRM